MKIAFFSAGVFGKEYFIKFNKKYKHQIKFFKEQLNEKNAKLAKGYECVCVFVEDRLNERAIKKISESGVKLIALRCAGFDNVDLNAAKKNKIVVVRVPEYSPFAVAEHTVGLMIALNRKLIKAHKKSRKGDFSLNGLLGFDMYGKTVGIIGTGKIGFRVVQILNGFGCKLLAYDPFINKDCLELGVEYASLEKIFNESDIITLHVPLLKETHHILNSKTIKKLKKGVMIINTSRGGLIDTKALIKGLESGRIGYAGLDVYENEQGLFFKKNKKIEDLTLLKILSFENVIITGHQAFFTNEAIANIAQTTLKNIKDFELGKISNSLA